MPPPAPPVYKTAAIRMVGTISSNGSSARTFDQIYYFQRTAFTGVWSPSVIESAFQTSVASVIMAALNNRATQEFTAVRCVEDATNAEQQFAETAVGAVAGDSQVLGNYAYLLERTGFRGKNWRGAKKYYPISEADTTAPNADVFNAAATTRLNAIGTALITGFTDGLGNVWKYGLLSKSLSQVEVNPTNIIWTPITQILLRETIGFMKKRRVSSVY
jgi:hypothetical protein